MLEKQFIYYCAPTLAGIKTASLFSHKFQNKNNFLNDILILHDMFSKKGVVVDVLNIKDGRALVYVYRPEMLIKDLSDKKAREILIRYGYDQAFLDSFEDGCDHKKTEMFLEKVLFFLKARLEMHTCFPHEIGLFLGYPAGDVYEFIRQKGKNCMYCGMWKVYCNVDKTKELFEKYKHCNLVYRQVYNNGRNISDMIVSA